MDKRYQVFVSSTYIDLQEERKEVMQALLELDCIPSGMELFPASNEDQWSLIKRVIDDSDYYIVIIGGRYGSIGKEGISYTEMEYRYALETNKPIIAFIHGSPSTIPVGKSEETEEGKQKLKEFLELAKCKLIKTWNTPTELGSVVSRSIVQLIKREPGIGWVKASNVPSESATKEILNLKSQIEELQNKLNEARLTAPKGTENLSQGTEDFKINYTFEVERATDLETYTYSSNTLLTWNEIFFEVSPLMIDEAIDKTIVSALNRKIRNMNYKRHMEDGDLDAESIENYAIDMSCYHTIKVQLRALGLIKKSEKSRSVKDRNTYWCLTDYGDEVMTRLRAIKK
jgi:hypothetical protein